MSDAEETEPDVAPSVVSLLDRLPPARRARHLAALSVKDHGLTAHQRAGLAAMAERLVDFDPEEMREALAQAPHADDRVREAVAASCAAHGAKLYLENDHEGAFAVWEAGIADTGADAAPILTVRAVFHTIRGDLVPALADLDRALVLAPTDADAYARRGDIHLKMSQRGEAIANYRRAAQLDAENVVALSGMGRCLLHEHDHEHAIVWYSRAIKAAPRAGHLRVERALCFEETGRFADAINDLDVAIQVDPDDAESFHARGRCRPDKGSAAAVADFTRAIAIDPKNADVWIARARAHLHRNDLDGARSDSLRATELDAQDARAHFTLGLVHHVRRELRDALACYETAAKLAPTEETYVFARVLAAQQLGDAAGVRAVLDRVVALAPANPEVRAAHAGLLAAEGNHAGALEHFHAAIALGSALPDAKRAAVHHERAATLRALGRLDEALEDEERAMSLDPSVADHHAWFGALLALTDGDAVRAEAALTHAIALDPNNAEHRLHRAILYERLERWDAALADHEKAVELDPGEGALYFRRGVARWQASRSDEEQHAAIEDFERALALVGDGYAEILLWSAHARSELDDPGGALADLERAIRIEPDSGEAFFLRSTCKRALGDEAGAREDLERSAELEWPEACEALEQAGQSPA